MIESQECEGCLWDVSLLPANLLTWNLISKMMPGLIRETGADYRTIEYVMDLYEIRPEDRKEIFEKVLVFIEVFLDYLNEKRR